MIRLGFVSAACLFAVSLPASEIPPDTGVPVSVPVTIQERAGAPAHQLTPDDILVSQNKQRRQIISMAPIDRSAGIELWILIDDGLTKNFGTQLSDVKQFVMAQPPATRIGIGYIRNGMVEKAQAPTPDHALAAHAMRLPTGPAGISADPYSALKDLIHKWPATTAAREVLLVSNGVDPDYGSGPQDPYLDSAIQAAQRADVVVLALGESGTMSGEAGSRANLDLPGNQQQLLDAVVATGRPVVLLVFSGRPLVLTSAAQHVPAIMEVWFPGTEAGNAIANVLYGDVLPSGKLPISFPYAVGQEPLYYAQFPTGRPAVNADLSQPPGPDSHFISRYIDEPNDALFPFGHGLTYTHFAYSAVAVSRASLPLAEAHHSDAHKLVTATALVTNTGERAATEIVQCYVRNLGASLEQPVRSLQGFARVTLKPGESKNVSFDLGFPELSFYDSEGHAVIEPTNYTVWIGGSSTADQHASFKILP